MNDNEIINKAIQELKNSEKPYKMFKDFSFMKGMEWGEDRFQKIRYLLIKSSPFEKHTDHAIKFSEIGLEISNNHKDWFDYKKSLKPKTEYVKWIGVGIAALSLIWNIFQGMTNSKLSDDNRILGDEIEALQKENAGLLKNSDNKTQQRYDDAEIQVIDLIHLVETENKEVFSELISYYGTDKTRSLKTHVDVKSKIEKETNNRYFNSVKNILKECYELKKQTGNIDKDYTFIITDSKKVNINEFSAVRVSMNYCTPNEEECIDKTYFFDFVLGNKEYLLIDIDKSELYKSKKL